MNFQKINNKQDCIKYMIDNDFDLLKNNLHSMVFKRFNYARNKYDYIKIITGKCIYCGEDRFYRATNKNTKSHSYCKMKYMIMNDKAEIINA